MQGDDGLSSGDKSGSGPTPAPQRAEPAPAWWRLRPWSTVLTGVAAVGLLAVGFVAGDAVGGSGRTERAGAASPSAAVAATSASSAVGVPSSALSASPGPATPTPNATRTATPSSAPPVFQEFTGQNCESASAPTFSCETVVVAQFTGGGGASQYTAQVTFTTPGVQVGTTAEDDATVFAQTTVGAFDVSVFQLSFPTVGAYPYTVTVTDTANGYTATWNGTLPVGETPSPG